MNMDKKEMDKMRSSTLYDKEILKVRYTGKAINFPKNELIDCIPYFKCKSGLPYPQPKWIACDYRITDNDGDDFPIAHDRYGKIYPGFEWVK